MNYTLGLQLTADKSGLTTAVVNASGDLRNLGNAGKGAGDSINAGMRKAETGADRLEKQFSALKAQFLGFFAAAKAVDVLRGAGRMADEYSNLSARLKGAIGDSVNFASAQQRVFQVAQDTSSELGNSSQLVGRLSKALREMGETSETAFAGALGLTTTINQSFAISGASIANSAAGILQFTQALNAGVLRGDEFNSVMENAPRLAEALGKSLGKTTGELRAMAEAGGLTSDKLITALKGQAGVIAAEYAKMPLTIGRAWQQVENAVLQYVGQADQASGASFSLANALKAVADNIAPIANSLIALAAVGIATVFARGVSAVVAYGVASVQARIELGRTAAAEAALAEMTLYGVTAKVEATAATLALARAEEARLRAQFGLTASSAQVAAQTAVVAVAEQAATVATVELAAAQAALNASQVAAPGLIARMGAGLLAFVGGPVGAAILALGALYFAVTYFDSASLAAQKTLDQQTESIRSNIDALRTQTNELLGAGSAQEQKIAIAEREQAATRKNADTLADYLAVLQLVPGAGQLASGASLYLEYRANSQAESIKKAKEATAELQIQQGIASLVATRYGTEFFNSATKIVTGAYNAADAVRDIRIAMDALSGSPGPAQLGRDIAGLTKSATEELAKLQDQLLRAQGKNPLLEDIKALGTQAPKSLADLAAAIASTTAKIEAATKANQLHTAAQRESTKETNQASKALEELTKLTDDLTQSFTGPGAQALEQYTDRMRKIDEQVAKARDSSEALAQAELARVAASNVLVNALDEVKQKQDEVNAATAAADEAVRNYTGSAQEELKLIGKSSAERKIQEAGLKAETELRDRITEALKHQGSAYETMGEAAREALIKQEGDAERAAQAQILVSESAKQAADDFERNWQSALDAVANDFVKGGTNIGDIARRFLQDLTAQYAKKIFLDVITRYTSQGKKDGSTSSGDSEDEPTAGQRGFAFLAGVSGVRDAYRTGGGLGGAASGALAGAQAGSAILPGIGTIIGGIVGALAGFFGGAKDPDLRLGATGVTRKPEQTFQTAFGSQQIGVRGGTSTEEFTKLITDFDKTLGGIVGNFQNGQAQLDAVKQRLSTWSVDLKGAAITTEAVLGSRFSAILSTFSSDIQAFVGTAGTVAERAQRLQDAAFIESAASGGKLMTTFNSLAAVLKENAVAGESVQQTYDRISQASETLTAALGLSGLSLDLSRQEFIKFATDIQTAAGGTREAATLWQTYFDTFYTATEVTLTKLEQAQASRVTALTALGLSAHTSAEAFRAAFESALPTLSPEEVVRWLQAGTAISNANAAQAAYNATLGETTEKFTEEQKARQAALASAIGSLSEIESQINNGFTQVARSGLSSFQTSLLQINDTMLQSVASLNAQRRAAVLAGASAEQLARFDTALGRAHLLAAAQAAAAISQLRDAGRSLVAQLGIGLGGPTNAAQSFADAGVSAFNQIGEAAGNVYESQLSALKSIQEWLDSQRLGNLSSLTPSERFDEANAQFAAALAAAQGGDPDALRRITQLADSLLSEGRGRFASSQGYTDLEERIRAALAGLVAAGPQGNGQSGGGSANGLGDQLGQQTTENRTELLAQLSQIVRDLIAATGGSLSAVAASLSLDLSAFVTQLGGATVATLGNVANQLGIEATEVAAAVGVTLGALGDRQSLLNDSVEAAIDLLPKSQRDQLQPLLDQVEASADDPEGLKVARDALVNRILKIGGEAAEALAPFFDEIDPVDALVGIDGVLRAGFGDMLLAIGSVTTAINGVGSFDVGTGYVTRNGLAQIHEGEMIIDPATSASFRRYGIPLQPVSGLGSDSQGTIDRLERIERVLERGFGTVAGAVVDRSEREIRSNGVATNQIIRESEFNRANKRRTTA